MPAEDKHRGGDRSLTHQSLRTGYRCPPWVHCSPSPLRPPLPRSPPQDSSPRWHTAPLAWPACHQSATSPRGSGQPATSSALASGEESDRRKEKETKKDRNKICCPQNKIFDPYRPSAVHLTERKKEKKNDEHISTVSPVRVGHCNLQYL